MAQRVFHEYRDFTFRITHVRFVIYLINYLRDRYWMITLVDQRSDKMRISLGVPQGSILGPFLF